MLVLGLCAILVAASLPAFSGWWTEHRLRTVAGTLIDTVQASRINADKTGLAQTILFQEQGAQENPHLPPETHIFSEDPTVHWTFQRFGDDKPDSKLAEMRIDAHGLVDPLLFRVQDGNSFVEYRFDILTGHAIEESSSF